MQSHTHHLQLNISFKQIIQLAAPISFALLVPQANFIINNIFLGGLGETALGTAGITGVYYLLFAVIGHGLANGVQTFFARRAGQNEIHAFSGLFVNAWYIKMASALLCILLTWILSPMLLNAALNNADVYQNAVEFLNIRILGLPFLYTLLLCNAFLIGTNHTRFLIYIFGSEALFNIVLDYGLIYGHFGLPKMGFKGAALASVLAEVMGMLVGFWMLWKHQFIKDFQLLHQCKWRTHIVLPILSISAPLVFQHIISIASWLLFFVVIEHYGARALAVSNLMRNLFGLYGVLIWAFANTTNTMVSNVIGQDRHDLVIPLIKRITLLSLAAAVIMGGLFNLFPMEFAAMYGQSSEFAADVVPVVRVLTVSTLVMSVSAIWLNAITGTGNTTVNLLIELAGVVSYITYVWITGQIIKTSLPIVWASELVYWLIILLLAGWYIRSKKWKHKTI